LAKAADLWKIIERYSAFLVTAHVRPDVDAAGSELALTFYLEKLAKTCCIVNESPLPSTFSFLPHTERALLYPDGMDFAYDAVICLDASSLDRTGQVGANVRDVPLLVVDHHPYTEGVADLLWVEPASSSTGEMLYDFMRYHRELIDAETATCLYAAILTDTGRFTYSNTGPKTLEAAADLVALGADPHFIASSYYENLTDGQMSLIGLTASRIRRAARGKVAYASLSAEDFENTGAGPELAQELAELPRLLKGVEVGVLLRDVGGKVKVSLRSKGGADVKTIAEHFGGGGHREASGFLLELPLPQAEIEVIRFLEEYLENRHA
jgi:phosphoesterase RecJ-like protein